MMELETSSREFIDSEDNGFPIPTQPVRNFWLCIDCSEKFVHPPMDAIRCSYSSEICMG